VPGVGVQGTNNSGEIGYTGPCSPSGTHRYYARLFALDAKLKLPPGATYELTSAMKAHILAQAELMGMFARKARRAA
jgi:Raf kinase inhibitor-like YbhB/YbcL family protein